MFRSLDEFKAKAEFFKAGSVVPKRIMRLDTYKRHGRMTFGNDTWAFSSERGYILIICDQKSSFFICKFSKLKAPGYYYKNVRFWRLHGKEPITRRRSLEVTPAPYNTEKHIYGYNVVTGDQHSLNEVFSQINTLLANLDKVST